MSTRVIPHSFISVSYECALWQGAGFEFVWVNCLHVLPLGSTIFKSDLAKSTPLAEPFLVMNKHVGLQSSFTSANVSAVWPRAWIIGVYMKPINVLFPARIRTKTLVTMFTHIVLSIFMNNSNVYRQVYFASKGQVTSLAWERLDSSMNLVAIKGGGAQISIRILTPTL